jgi:uncharacterized membrane protein YeaQ/YmgE (transglycosylase-associated protein family)
MNLEHLAVTAGIGIAGGWLGSLVIGAPRGGLGGYLIAGLLGGVVGYWLLGYFGISIIAGNPLLDAIITSAIGAIIVVILARQLGGGK